MPLLQDGVSALGVAEMVRAKYAERHLKQGQTEITLCRIALSELQLVLELWRLLAPQEVRISEQNRTEYFPLRPTLQPRWPASISAALAWQYTLGPFWFLTRYTP